MKGKDMTISVRRLPNGYAMDIGGFRDGRKKRQYMYFSAEQLIAGFFLHFGCKEVEYIDGLYQESSAEVAKVHKRDEHLQKQVPCTSRRDKTT